MASQSDRCLGPFVMDSEGRLTPRLSDVPPRFLVRWRGRTVRAHVLGADGAGGTLALQSVLGRVPSSAAAGGGRAQSFELLCALRRGSLDAWKLRLLPDHRAVLEAEAQIALPITAVGLVGEVTGFLLAVTPYFDLMDEIGFRPAADAMPAPR